MVVFTIILNTIIPHIHLKKLYEIGFVSFSYSVLTINSWNYCNNTFTVGTTRF
jgi:hypothetical protein